MLSKKIRQYLIDFLLGAAWVQSAGEDRYQRRFEVIGYTDDPESMKHCPIIIRPSGFFDTQTYGTEAAYPSLPLKQWRGIPILFGEPTEEWSADGTQLIIHADLLASTYFLISRYEEMYRRDVRDKHGRFPGRESLPYRAGFIHRPLVDEYGAALREVLFTSGIAIHHNLRLEDRPETFSQVNLTHDLSRPYNHRGWRSFMRAWLREKRPILESLRLSLSPQHEDDYYTFPKFLRWDNTACQALGPERSSIFFFVRMPSAHPLDKPRYNPRSLYLKRILNEGKRYGVKVGLQCSYASGMQPKLVAQERQLFERLFHQRPNGMRHNRLMALEPEDMMQAYASGFRNDYGMGYPDVAGFRLGTCRAVRYINPNTQLLTDLILHPLILRDITLSDPHCMGLDQEEATQLAMDLVRTTARYHGELTLLWHNDLLSQTNHPWLSVLYRSLLRLIEELSLEPEPQHDY